MGSGGKGGGGGGGPNYGAINDIAQQQMRMAQDIYNRADPLRNIVFGELESLLTGQPRRGPSTFVPSATAVGAPAMAPAPLTIPASIMGPDGAMITPDPTAYAAATTTKLYTDPATGQSWTIQVPDAAMSPAPAPGSPAMTEIPGEAQPSILRSVFAPARDALELQYQAATRAIQETSPMRGGQMSRALSNVQTDRARSVAGMEADLLKNAFNLATGIATNSPTQAMQGLGSATSGLMGAAGIANQQQAMAAQQNMALGQGIGQLAGQGMMANAMKAPAKAGGGLAGAEAAIALSPAFLCWVADALYGADTVQARMARLWVTEGWQGWTADLFRAIYRRIGPCLAAAIERYPWLGTPLRPLFDRFVVRGWDYDIARLTAVCQG